MDSGYLQGKEYASLKGKSLYLILGGSVSYLPQVYSPPKCPIFTRAHYFSSPAALLWDGEQTNLYFIDTKTEAQRKYAICSSTPAAQ